MNKQTLKINDNLAIARFKVLQSEIDGISKSNLLVKQKQILTDLKKQLNEFVSGISQDDYLNLSSLLSDVKKEIQKRKEDVSVKNSRSIIQKYYYKKQHQSMWEEATTYKLVGSPIKVVENVHSALIHYLEKYFVYKQNQQYSPNQILEFSIIELYKYQNKKISVHNAKKIAKYLLTLTENDLVDKLKISQPKLFHSSVDKLTQMYSPKETLARLSL